MAYRDLVTLVLRNHYQGPDQYSLLYIGIMPECMAYGIGQQLMTATLGTEAYIYTSGEHAHWSHLNDYGCPAVEDGELGTYMLLDDKNLVKRLEKLRKDTERNLTRDLGGSHAWPS
jgi:hypothetical protein